MIRLCSLLLLLAALPGPALAGDWPHWRGPHWNGCADETNLPESWSDTKNVAWKTALPGPSSSTPIVCGDRVYLVSGSTGSSDILGMCLDAATGKTLWSVKLASNRKAMQNDMASPSPVTDGKRIYFLFGTGTCAAVDLDGKVLWSRELGNEYIPFAQKFGYSASPTLYQGKLFVQCLCAKPAKEASYLLAIDPATGKTLWKQSRLTPAVEESKDSYGTPIPYGGKNYHGVLLAGGDVVTCHDAESGKELWRYAYGHGQFGLWRLVPSVVVADDLIVCPIPRGGPLFGVKPAGEGKATLAWTWPENSRSTDVGTPAFYKGLLYVLDGDRKDIRCVDPATGKEIWRQPLDATTLWASPTASDDKIYCIDKKGKVFVLAAGETAKIVSQFETNEKGCIASIAIARGCLFLRSATTLWCIRKTDR